MDSRSLAGLAVQTEPTAKTIRDDVVNDMEAKTGAALIAACCEEWVECLVPDVRTHAAAVVGKKNFDTVIPGRPRPDIDGTPAIFRKRVCDRIEEEVGQHLSI